MSSERKNVWIAAGGTAGHINSALVIGEELSRHDIDITYISGQRPIDYKILENKNAIHLCSRALLGRNIFKLCLSIFWNIIAFFKMFFRQSPDFAIGCGGFVCGPTLLAAKLKGKKIYVLEQNSVMGFTNKVLSGFADHIFLSFPRTQGFKEEYRAKSSLTGNPIRKSIRQSQLREKKNELRLLVFGGSLGAEEINQLIKKLSESFVDFPLEIIHQTGKGKNLEINATNNVNYQQFEYLDNIPELYDWCDLTIARGGASTISELLVVNKPSFIIPALYHKDKHQVHNAEFLAKNIIKTKVSVKKNDHYQNLVTFLTEVFGLEKMQNQLNQELRSEEKITKFLLSS